MSEITEQEIESVRDELLDYLPDSIILRRKHFVGGDEFETGNVATDVPARMKAGFGSFQPIADRFQGITPYTVSLPFDTKVQVSDEIIDKNGVVYQVRDVREHSTFQGVVKVLVDRIH